MALNYKTESLDEIPEQFHELYSENNGQYVLTGVQGIKTEDDINKLQEGLRKERNDHKALKEKFKAFADLDPDDVRTKLDSYEELQAKLEAAGEPDEEKLQKLVEAQVVTKTRPLEREKQKLMEEYESVTQELNQLRVEKRNRTIRDAVMDAATNAKLLPTAMEDAVVLAERMLEIDDDGRVVTRDEVGVTPGIDAKVWLEEMQEKRPHWWPESQGSGAKGGKGGTLGGPNPWDPKNRNITEQGRIYREDPEKAKRMAAQHGITL